MPFFDTEAQEPKSKQGQFFDIEDNSPRMIASHTPGEVVKAKPTFVDKAKNIGKKVLQEAGDVGEGIRGLAGMVTTLPVSLGNYAGGVVDSIVQEDLSKENIDRNVERRSRSTEGLTNFLSGGPVTSERGQAMAQVAGNALTAPGVIANEAVTALGNQVINTEDYPNVVPNIAGAASVLADIAVPVDAAIGIKAMKGTTPKVKRGYIPESEFYGIGDNTTPSNFEMQPGSVLEKPMSPSRFRQEPVLNDMPQQPKMLPEPERITQRRADVEAAVAADNELLANQIADAKNQPSGWVDHENLSGPTVVTVADSLATDPIVKPVLKGTVAEVKELGKTGTINPREHQVFYPEGSSNPDSSAYVIRKVGVPENIPIEAVKQELRMGGQAESRWLGYPDRTNVPPGERVTAAVTKNNEVLTDPAQIMEASTNKDVKWAAEGSPEEVVQKAQEVATPSQEIKTDQGVSTPSLAKDSPESNTEATTALTEDTSVLKSDIISPDELDSLMGETEFHAGIHPKEVLRGVSTVTDTIVKAVSERTTPTAKIWFKNLIGIPQRIAASGRYPTYTKMYNEAYQRWIEGRNSIAHDLFAKRESAIPEESFIGMRELLTMEKEFNAAQMADFRRLLKTSDIEKRFFTAEELASERNPLGRPVDANVIKAYDETRKAYYAAGQVDLKETVNTAMNLYADQPWYPSLKGWVDEGLRANEVKEYLEQNGILYDKDSVRALDAVNKVQDFIIKQIIPVREKNPEYINRVRPEGEWKVSVYELNADGSRGNEIFMNITPTEKAAKELYKYLLENPTDELRGFPDHYRRLSNENGVDKLTPGEHYEIVKPSRNENVTHEDVWAYSGTMSSKVALLDQIAEKAAKDGRLSPDQIEAVHKEMMKGLLDMELQRGFGRTKIARKDHLIEGYDLESPVTNLMDHIRQMAGYHTKARYATDVAKLFKDASSDERRLMNSFIIDSLKKENTNMAKTGATVRQLLVWTQLALRGVAPVQNLTQSYVWAARELAPRLKPYGIDVKKPDILIAKNQIDITKQAAFDVFGKGSDTLTPIQKKALDDFSRIGASQASNLREVAGLNQGKTAQYLTQATEYGMTPFSLTEVLNRESTFLTSFNLLMEKGIPYEEAFKVSKEYALEVNIDASPHNYPGIVRSTGQIGKTLFTFGRMPASYMSWLYKKAIIDKQYRPVVTSMAVLAALGGVKALPFANEINDFMERFMGVSPKLAIRNTIKKVTKEKGIEGANKFIESAILTGSLSALFGVDLSRSLAPSLPVVSEVMASGDFVKGLSGAPSSLVVRTGRSIKATSEGDTLRAIENFPLVPVGLVANSLKAYRQSTEGVTTSSGLPIEATSGGPLKMTTGEALTLGLFGANPTRIAREQDIRSSMLKMQEFYQARERNIKKRVQNNGGVWTPAYRKELADLKKEIDKYNVAVKADTKIRKQKASRLYKRSIRTYNYITEED